MDRWSRWCWLMGLALLAAAAQAFAPLPWTRTSQLSSIATRPTQIAFRLRDEEPRLVHRFEAILDRLDTMKTAGFVDRNKNNDSSPVMMRGPGFKRILFWFFVGFMYKWYRARFINKIPVWDRQPQWNMVVTSREQEKELKAYTCKNCGSTLFIARNRNWFFEGDTGLGGLGCYTCGAKGKDNFVMDRDRILEDVGEDDDYFDYERPLDFVTAAERRALLKRAEGDEDAANQMLIDQSSSESTSSPPEGAMDAVIEKTVEETKNDEEAVDDESIPAESGDEANKQSPVELVNDEKDGGVSSSSTEANPKKKKKKRKKKKKKSADESTSPLEERKESDTSSMPESSEQQVKDEPKEEQPMKKDLETSPKKAVSDEDPWDDLDALGI